MKILVTGGAGFIGSHVVDAYIKEGHDVVVIDDLSSGKEANVNAQAKFYKTDIRSEELFDVVASERPDIINHHAAQISVPASVENPVLDSDVNIRGLLNVLEAARKNQVRKIIFISSGGAIYGDVDEFPTSEESPVKPMSPYAVAKFCAEKYLDFYWHQYELDYTVLRYANVYGPRQIAHGEAGVIAIFMDNLISGAPSKLNHFPDDPLGMTRDYCYVGDIAEANKAVLENGHCKAYNIGTGVPTHTRELFDIIYGTLKEKLPGLAPELASPELEKARAGDLKRSCLKIGKAMDELGWRPKTSLLKGIRETLNWRLAAALGKGDE